MEIRPESSDAEKMFSLWNAKFSELYETISMVYIRRIRISSLKVKLKGLSWSSGIILSTIS